MLFNSIDFALFLPIVFILYWFVFNKNLKQQNFLILAASYVFYGWWDWRFLFLLFFSTAADYFICLGLKNQDDKFRRKFLLYVSITVNLGLLGFFKYYNFFVENFVSAFTFFGNKIEGYTLYILLPVGISFYTFQTLSYTIDVYRKKLAPARDFISYSAFVSFFPQLVAGPIERATHLLPQFHRERHFNPSNAVNGLRQLLWGLFKKMVIADNCAEYVNIIFNNSDEYSGSTLLLGAVLFSFQIYGDFSGYSDIAIGTARLFDFNLMQNFAYPYFSRDVAEFWRRWHISLSTWFRDYLYIPLGGSKAGTWIKIRNTSIVFLVSGFWHGAAWTFIIWGALNAIYFIPLLITDRNRRHLDVVAEGKTLPNLNEILHMVATFILITFAWIFFRAQSVEHAAGYIASIISPTLFTIPEIFPIEILVLIMVFIVVEWFGREQQYALQKIGVVWPRYLRWAFYYSIIFCIFVYGDKEEAFIYFQF